MSGISTSFGHHLSNSKSARLSSKFRCMRSLCQVDLVQLALNPIFFQSFPGHDCSSLAPTGENGFHFIILVRGRSNIAWLLVMSRCLQDIQQHSWIVCQHAKVRLKFWSGHSSKVYSLRDGNETPI